MNEPHDLNNILLRRAAPRAPYDLADRILYRAVRTPQSATPFTLRSLARECLSLLVIPRPALAFSLCLMIGLFGGWAATQSADDAMQVLDMAVVGEDWL